MAVNTDADNFRNTATGDCIELSTTQCFDNDAAVDLSALKAAKADGTCLTLLESECAANDAAVAVSSTKVKIASTSACHDLTAGNCWNATTESEDPTSGSNHLHSTSGYCVALTDSECFKNDAASDNGPTQARKSDGTCVDITEAQCWDGTAPKDTSSEAPLVFKRESDSGCVDVGESECYNETTEAAAATNDYNEKTDDGTCQ